MANDNGDDSGSNATSLLSDNLIIETACVSIAKMQCQTSDNWIDSEGPRWSLFAKKVNYDRDVKRLLCNEVARNCAEEGQLEKAEHWMSKLDAKSGVDADVRTFNAILLAQSKSGNLVRAEEWFAKVMQPHLHPELNGVRPDRESYDIMVRCCAAAHDWARVGKYLEEMDSQGYRLKLHSHYDLIRSAVNAGEVRRAHHWCRALMKKGCSKRSNYSSEQVHQEYDRLPSMRRYKLEELFSTVLGC